MTFWVNAQYITQGFGLGSFEGKQLVTSCIFTCSLCNFMHANEADCDVCICKTSTHACLPEMSVVAGVGVLVSVLMRCVAGSDRVNDCASYRCLKQLQVAYKRFCLAVTNPGSMSYVVGGNPSIRGYHMAVPMPLHVLCSLFTQPLTAPMLSPTYKSTVSPVPAVL